jgi:glycosyltransferase involved in cell wall biosynthesis
MRGLVESTPERLDGVRRYLAGHCNEILSMSVVVSDSAIRVGMPHRRISVVYDGVDLSEWAPWNEERRDAARRSLGIPADELVVLIPGNLKRWKGQQDAIESFRLLPSELRRRCRVCSQEVPPRMQKPRFMWRG